MDGIEMQTIIEKTLKTGKKITVAPLTSKTELLAAKAAGDASGFAGNLAFLNECIKMTLLSVNGIPIDYTTLDLDTLFSMREIRELRNIFNEVNVEDEGPLEGAVVTVE